MECVGGRQSRRPEGTRAESARYLTSFLAAQVQDLRSQALLCVRARPMPESLPSSFSF